MLRASLGTFHPTPATFTCAQHYNLQDTVRRRTVQPFRSPHSRYQFLSTSPAAHLRAVNSVRDREKARSISSSPKASKTDHPEYATTKDEVQQDYVPAGERGVEDYSDAVKDIREVGLSGARLPLEFSLADKVCVVTGGAQGTGKLLAKTLVEAGSNHLAIVDINEEQGKRTIEQIKAYLATQEDMSDKVMQELVKLRYYKCDVSDEDQTIDTFEAINEDFGRIDILTVCAGIRYVAPKRRSSHARRKVQSPFSISVDGAFFSAREAAHFMEQNENGGSIVVIGSMSEASLPATAVLTQGTHHPEAPYEAALAAARQMSASLALEWAKLKIRVNCITPGPMSTTLTKAIADEHPELKKVWENLTPAGRLGNPADLKGPLVYLASDTSSYVTATSLSVDGGWSNS